MDGVDILKEYAKAIINIDQLKTDRRFKVRGISVIKLLDNLEQTGYAQCIEVRYDFKNTKISTGLNGINRIFLPQAKLYPTLVASDTNDYISTENVSGETDEEYKQNFLEQIYKPGKYRRISKEEACIIQGFPKDFILPEARNRWMKLIGNSVAVTLISKLIESVIKTGVFKESDFKVENQMNTHTKNPEVLQLELF